MKEEMKSFRKQMNVKVSSEDLFDVFFWRLQNASVYLGRLIKRQRPERSQKDPYKEMRNFLAVWPADR